LSVDDPRVVNLSWGELALSSAKESLLLGQNPDVSAWIRLVDGLTEIIQKPAQELRIRWVDDSSLCVRCREDFAKVAANFQPPAKPPSGKRRHRRTRPIADTTPDMQNSGRTGNVTPITKARTPEDDRRTAPWIDHAAAHRRPGPPPPAGSNPSDLAVRAAFVLDPTPAPSPLRPVSPYQRFDNSGE
jgi:hypothetical protein